MSLSIRLAVALLLAALLLAPLPAASAEKSNGWRERLDWPPAMELDHVLVQTSLYTRHFSPEPDHHNQQELIGLELHNSQHWLVGGARFLNSFKQESFFLYAGREFPFWEPHPSITARAKLSAGLLHGYRGEHRDKIPFNHFGTAPAALPSVGLQWGRFETDLIMFGTAGAMIIGGIRF